MTIALPISDSSSAAWPLSQASRIVLNRAYLLIGIAILVMTMLTQIFDTGGSELQTDFIVALGFLLAAMVFVRGLYVRAAQFLFSPSFWLLITYFFYFVLKALEMASKDAVTPTLIKALWLSTLFLVTYGLMYAWSDAGLRRRSAQRHRARRDTVIPPGFEWTLLIIFFGFKLLGIALLASAGGNALEVSEATQNAGAAYLYRIPMVGNVILLALLFNAFKNNRGWAVVVLALAAYLVEALMSTNRLSLVMVVLWTTFLYHRYRSPISLGFVALIGMPLVLVVVLLGYARNIEVGSAAAYVEAVSALTEEPTLISDLFLGRMDMLPQVVIALDLHKAGVLPNLNGGSYAYALMHSIPRSIWEEKPLLTAALVTSQTHPGAFADGVNIFPSIIVEGYLNLALAGVMLSGALVGFFSRQFERAIVADRLVPSVWALSMFTFPMALFNEGVHSNFTGTLLYMTALNALLYQLLLFFGVLKRRRLAP